MKTTYGISFNRCFSRPVPMVLAEIQSEIGAVERGAEGLLADVLGE